jgi:hypothetical protein
LHRVLGVDLNLVEAVLDDLDGHGWFPLVDELSIACGGGQTTRTVTLCVPSSLS